MVNTLAIRSQNDLTTMLQQADTLVKSGYLPKSITTPQQAVAIMTMGRELGIDAWAALNGINVIQGKPTIAPQLMLALINRSGELADISIESTDKQCTVTLTRRGRSAHRETFTMQDAAAMGLSGKDNWKKQTAVMLKWRAVSAACRVVFPDVIIGFYTPDEINPDAPIDYETGEIVDAAPEHSNGQPYEVQEYQDAPVDSDKPMTAKRPYAPRHLLERLSEIVAEELADFTMQAPLTVEAAQDLAVFMRRILPVEDARHAFLFAAFGVKSCKELNHAEDAAIRAWVGKGSKVELAKREADDLLASLDSDGKLAELPEQVAA